MLNLVRRLAVPLAFASLALVSVGCGGGGTGNSCEDLGKHVLAQLEKERKEQKELDKERERIAEATARPYVDRLVGECRDQEWSEEVRSCFMKAATQEDFNRCRALLDGDGTAEPAPNAPGGNAGARDPAGTAPAQPK